VFPTEDSVKDETIIVEKLLSGVSSSGRTTGFEPENASSILAAPTWVREMSSVFGMLIISFVTGLLSGVFSNKKQIADNEILFCLGFLVDTGLFDDDEPVSAMRILMRQLALSINQRGLIKGEKDHLVRELYDLELKICHAEMVADAHEVTKFLSIVRHGLSCCEDSQLETLMTAYHCMIDYLIFTGKRDIK
jgi:hypothetical protein